MKKLLPLIAIIAMNSCQSDEEIIEEVTAPLPNTCVCGEIMGRDFGPDNTRIFWVESDCTGEVAEIYVQGYYYELHGVGEHICLDEEEVFGELVPW